MNFIKSVAFLFIFITLSACEQLNVKESQGPLVLTQQNLYSELKSLEAQQVVAPNNTQLKERIATLRLQVETLEIDHLARAEAFWSKKQYGAALNQIDAGLLSLPESSALIRRRTYYIDTLDRRLAFPREELLLLRGRYIADVLRVHKQADEIAPHMLSGEKKVQELEKEKEVLAAEMIQIGERAVERKHFGFARWAFNVATQLEHPQAGKSLKELSRLEGQKQRPEKIKPEPELTEAQVLATRRSSLKSKSETALEGKRVQELLALLQEAQVLFPADGEFSLIRKKAQPLIDVEAKRLDADAQKKYQLGDFAAAIQLWRVALQLQPDNKDYASQIERAQRVEANLKTLKK